MPGKDFFTNTEVSAASAATPSPAPAPVAESPSASTVYYNARLDPKNYLEGPLSTNAATRLRQMLARPG
ncbi:hypothetical protein BDQ12DRAFT_673822, partial [Crucibulum laeve]